MDENPYKSPEAEVTESLASSERPQAGLGLVSVALVLPVLSGVLLCFVASPSVAFAISLSTVVATATLIAIDARRLGTFDLHGRPRVGAGLMFVGICLMWVVGYPIAFFRRRDFTAPNLGFVSLFVVFFFFGVPYLYSYLAPPSLPSCDSEEVVQLVGQVIRSTPLGATVQSIDRHREVSYDRKSDVRHGECIVHTTNAQIPVTFVVEWLDRTTGRFQVRIVEQPD